MPAIGLLPGMTMQVPAVRPAPAAERMNAIEDTRHWLEAAVIGLNLCPFAKAVHGKGRIRWVESAASEPSALLAELVQELQHLAAADPQALETTLLVHPLVLGDFLDFNDFLDIADAALAGLGLEGTLQIASFHPQYRFAGADADDIANHTNRFAAPDAAPAARVEHRTGAGLDTRRSGHLRAQHPHLAAARARRLAGPARTLNVCRTRRGGTVGGP